MKCLKCGKYSSFAKINKLCKKCYENTKIITPKIIIPKPKDEILSDSDSSDSEENNRIHEYYSQIIDEKQRDNESLFLQLKLIDQQNVTLLETCKQLKDQLEKKKLENTDQDQLKHMIEQKEKELSQLSLAQDTQIPDQTQNLISARPDNIYIMNTAANAAEKAAANAAEKAAAKTAANAENMELLVQPILTRQTAFIKSPKMNKKPPVPKQNIKKKKITMKNIPMKNIPISPEK